MDVSQVIILFGGTSEERRVSVASAQHLCQVLPEATLWFQGLDGRVHVMGSEELLGHTDVFTRELAPAGEAAFQTLEAALDAPEAQGKTFLLGFHGGEGEDGTVQALLESRGLAFTGSGSRASAAGFDKKRTKALARAVGIRVVESRELPEGDAPAILEVLTEMFERWGPQVVKPLRGGSSVGLHMVREAGQLQRVAELVAAANVPYLAELFVSGREITVGVIDHEGELRALPCSEVLLAEGRSFDYEGKYLQQGTVEVTPADLPPEVSQEAQEIAIAAHRAVGCEGYSRTDVILGPQGPVMLEINTLPGMTRASFLPQQLEAAGIEVRAFLEGQLGIAQARRERVAEG